MFMIEYSDICDMAYKEYEGLEVYLYVSDHHYKELVSIRNLILCNYLYL